MERLLLQVPGGLVGLSGVLVGPTRDAPPDATGGVPVPVLGHGIGNFRDATTVGPGINDGGFRLVLPDDFRKCVAQTAEVHGICGNHRISEPADKVAALGPHVVNKRELLRFDLVHGVGWLGCWLQLSKLTGLGRGRQVSLVTIGIFLQTAISASSW